MGVSISANNSKYTFDMGYGGFFNLRKNIALSLDTEFGENYALMSKCISEREYKKNDMDSEKIINMKKLDVKYSDVIDFLYAPDTGGKISYRTCRKIHDLIKDIDFTGKGFRYAAYRENDYDEFKNFLLECYSKRRNMVWY